MGFAYYCYFVTDEISRHDSAGSETALDKVYSTWSARLKVTWKPTIFFDQNWIENNLVTKIWILLIRATIFSKGFSNPVSRERINNPVFVQKPQEA